MLEINESLETGYSVAKQLYEELGVDTDLAFKQISQVSLSLHCWQGDDVTGFESNGEEIGGGLAITGTYPGKARCPAELREDINKALTLIPGHHRLNLHASYAETGNRQVDRNNLQPEHFQNWMEWAKSHDLAIDFNPTYFAHPKAKDGFTLSHHDHGIRQFWIEHGIACRKIGEAMGKSQGSPCITNSWIPDGSKDTPADRKSPRLRLLDSLDQIYTEKIDPAFNRDAVECKLFGIGSESYVVGSHEFYLGYAIKNQILLCLDSGHFHPTEAISDKISSTLLWLDEILLHASRGVRWDSDHVVTWTDELQAIAQELVRGNYLNRVHLGLDFFDASINRVAAWVIGSRNLLKALLMAFLEPTQTLRQYELDGDYTSRLALMERLKMMPFGVVWDQYCLKSGVPFERDWMREIKHYERDVLSLR